MLEGGFESALVLITITSVGALAGIALLVFAWAFLPARWDNRMGAVVANTIVATTLVCNLAWVVVAAWLIRTWYPDNLLAGQLLLSGGNLLVVAVGGIGTLWRFVTARTKTAQPTEPPPPMSQTK